MSAAKNVNTALLQARHAIAKGVVDIAYEIRRQSVLSTPVDTGNLRKTAEIFIDGSQSQTPTAPPTTRVVSIRYSAPYAGYVHNASGKTMGKPRQKTHRGRYWDPTGSRPRFLAIAVEKVSPRLRDYIHARINQVMPNA